MERTSCAADSIADLTTDHLDLQEPTSVARFRCMPLRTFGQQEHLLIQEANLVSPAPASSCCKSKYTGQ
eukprot:6492270-Amphidinium_carterae.1